jgi:hypothetical protein
MVKQNSPESTKKKKSSAKDKATPKKSAQTKGPKKKDPGPKGKSTKKTAPARKAAAKPKPKAKPKPTAKPKGKKVAAKKPKVSIKELLLRKFDTGVLEELAAKSPYKAKEPVKIPAAPPFVTGYDEDETKRIRALLFNQFDLKGEVPAEEPRKPEPVEKAMPEVFTGPKYEPPDRVLTARPHPMAKAIKGGLYGLALLIAILIAASFSNRGKFYLENADGAVHMLRGKFAPTGTELVTSLEGIKMVNPTRDVYSKKEAYLIVCNHFQKKADEVLNEPGGPDFAKINTYLKRAASHAPTKELRDLVQLRLNGMNFLVLLHRADVAFTKGTLPDLQAAKEYLDKAHLYASMDYQRDLLGKRQAEVGRMVAELEAQSSPVSELRIGE